MGKKAFYILKIIQEADGKAITGKEILKELERYGVFIDIKSVYSCVQRINDFFETWVDGKLIASIKKTGFTIKKELFLDGELQFILDSITFHEDLNDLDKLRLKAKLLQLSSTHQKKRLVDFIPQEKQIAFSLLMNLSTIMKAIANKQVLSFQYITYEVVHSQLKEIPSQNGNEQDLYFVSPYQIISSNNHYYLIGYNEIHENELTTYRIDRMRLMKTIKKTFIEVREQFDVKDEIDKMTNMYISSQRETIQIECDKRLLREVASHFKTELKAEKLYHDHYLMTIEDVPISDGLIGWIMMLQDQIKVISPSSLQEEMKKRIEKMLNLYSDML